MSEWSLPDTAQEEFENVVKQFDLRPDVKRFLRGGFWRNFLTKYPESNTMHKKMLYVSEKAQQLSDKTGPGTALSRVQDAVYAGQCNCAYWHGVFGGLYLPHLRTAIYRNLLEAESHINELHQVKAQWHRYDIDCDGREEILYESKQQNAYFRPSCGGTLFEWDILAKRINLQNVLTRRKEAYHTRLRDFLAHPQNGDGGVKTIHDLVKVKEQNLDQHLNYDWYQRTSLIDHFLHPDTSYEGFRRCQYGEQGDFVLGEYQAETAPRKITLCREGTVWENNRALRIAVIKEVALSSGRTPSRGRAVQRHSRLHRDRRAHGA
jgi:alpha-amylase